MRLGILIVPSLVLAAARPGFPTCGDQATDAQAVADTRTAAASECDCAAAASHASYVACVVRVANTAARRGTLRPQCRTAVVRCAARSTCGRPHRAGRLAAVPRRQAGAPVPAALPAAVTPVQPATARRQRPPPPRRSGRAAAATSTATMGTAARRIAASTGRASTAASVSDPAARSAAAPGRRRIALRRDGSTPAAIRSAAATVIGASSRAAAAGRSAATAWDAKSRQPAARAVDHGERRRTPAPCGCRLEPAAPSRLSAAAQG